MLYIRIMILPCSCTVTLITLSIYAHTRTWYAGSTSTVPRLLKVILFTRRARMSDKKLIYYSTIILAPASVDNNCLGILRGTEIRVISKEDELQRR